MYILVLKCYINLKIFLMFIYFNLGFFKWGVIWWECKGEN